MSFTWFGPIPRVMIPDPELVKEVLSNKFGHLLANGVVNHDGEKWAKHRRILNPAFHHEKIKVISYRWLAFFSFQIAASYIYWVTPSLSKTSVVDVFFTADAASIFCLLR
jgi:hypothetical protein